MKKAITKEKTQVNQTRAEKSLGIGMRRLLSQNHRMLGVGRDLCGSSSPTPVSIKNSIMNHIGG